MTNNQNNNRETIDFSQFGKNKKKEIKPVKARFKIDKKKKDLIIIILSVAALIIAVGMLLNSFMKRPPLMLFKYKNLAQKTISSTTNP